MFTLLKVVGERVRSPTTFVMITNQKCQLYLDCLDMRAHNILTSDFTHKRGWLNSRESLS